MANVPISGLPFGVGPMTGNESFPGVAGGVTYQWALSQMLQAIPGGYVPNSREINTGTGLSGGGDLSANRTLILADTAVSPGIYGAATTIPQVTVDQQGRLTSVVNVPVSFAGFVPDTRQVIAGTGLSGGGALSSDVTLNLANTAVTLGAYGSGTQVATFTVDQQGRLTAAANVAIDVPGSGGVPNTRQVIAGTGLSGGGALSSNVTLNLANTTVVAAAYGGAATVGTFTVDAQGRLTAAADVAIAISYTAVSGLGTAATQNTGTSGATIPLLNAVNTWSATQGFTSTSPGGVPFSGTVVDNSASPGVTNLFHSTASPAAADGIWSLYQIAQDSGGNVTVYASWDSYIVDPTNGTEDGRLALRTMVAGALATRWNVVGGLYAEGQSDTGAGRVNAVGFDVAGTDIFARTNTWTGLNTISTTGTGAPLTLTSTDAGTTAFVFDLYRDSSSPAALDALVDIRFRGNDSGGNATTYVRFRGFLVDPTDGSEDSSLQIFTMVAGVETQQVGINAGVSLGSASGGAQGTGTLNGVGLFDDGVQVLPIILQTMVTASGQSEIDFTGIPSTAKRITVCFNGLSLSGTDNMLIQLGDAGGPENTGYVSVSADIDASETTVSSTAGIILKVDAAADAIYGEVVFTLMDAATFLWTCHGVVASSNGTSSITTAGSKALTAVLTQVRIDTTGTNTFDAGTVNVVYE
mgnify:CR=1 FL=1